MKPSWKATQVLEVTDRVLMVQILDETEYAGGDQVEQLAKYNDSRKISQ